MSHEEFDVNNSSRYMGGYDYAETDTVPNDDIGGPNAPGHGTLDAGNAVANTNNSLGIAGVAPHASYYVAKVRGYETGGSTYNTSQGIDYCTENADIISNSMSCGTSPCSLLNDSISAAWDAGRLIVNSAGNGVSCSDCIWYPARYPDTIAVVAITAVDTQDPGGTSSGPEAELSAPGSLVWAPTKIADYEYDFHGGTSAAAPHVAAVASLVWNFAPNMTKSVLRDLLDETAADIGTTIGRDETYGFGRVDAEAAVDEIFPVSLPRCRFAEPTRFDKLDAIRPVLSGTVDFRAWAESPLVSLTNVNLTFTRLLTTTTLTMNSTADSRVFERGVHTSSLTNGDYTVTISCRESDGNARTHARLYTITN